MTREAAQSTQDEEIYRTMTIDNSNRGVGNEINAKYCHKPTFPCVRISVNINANDLRSSSVDAG